VAIGGRIVFVGLVVVCGAAKDEFQFFLSSVGNKTDSDGFLKDGSFDVWFNTVKSPLRKNVRPDLNQPTSHHRRLLLHRERANTDHSP